MKHWLGVLIVAAVLAGIGLLIQPDESTGTENVAETIKGGLLALAALLGIIAALKLAAELMRADRDR